MSSRLEIRLGWLSICKVFILACFFFPFLYLTVSAQEIINVTDYSIALSDVKVREFKGKALFEVKGNPRKMVTLSSKGTSFALAKELNFTVSQYPFLNFEWNVEILPEGADLRSKDTDDQGGQVYVIIPSFPEMINYKAVGYVWDSAAPPGNYQSKKTGNVKYVVLHSGKDGTGHWHSEKRNVYQDFKELWGIDLSKSKKVVVSVSIDSDDTKSSARASYGQIYFSKK